MQFYFAPLMTYGNLSGFLQANHLYRRLKKAFNGHQENDKAPTPLTGIQILEKVNKVHHVFGKTSKKSSASSPWKKKINIL